MNIVYFTLLLLCSIQTCRAIFVMSGMYKDPVLASFEHFGEEEPVFSPVFNIFVWGASVVYLLLFLYFPAGMLITIGVIIAVPIYSFRYEVTQFVKNQQSPSRMFPLWYGDLVDRTTRQERRRIAYMWLRLPARTRIIYNTSTPYFMHWVDQVLLTIS